VPRFVKRYAELGDSVTGAARSYVAEVRAGQFPDERHSFADAPRSDADPPDEARYASGPSASGPKGRA
jgi:3-methyl-2-oxobutanoate hydroxymethyltransferase